MLATGSGLIRIAKLGTESCVVLLLRFRLLEESKDANL